MQKTQFAGLTVLEANESIYSDNSAFISRDRFEIDRELKLGVKMHRHDGKDGLSGPIVAPSGLVIGSGGSLPAGRSLTIGVSYEDEDGGETLVGPTNIITTPSPVQAPTYQLKGEAEYTSGTLSVDTYTYAITLVDASGGETPLGPPVTVTRDPGFAEAGIWIEGLRGGEAETWIGEGVVAWRLYRARAGGEYVFLAEGETTQYHDTGEVSPDCDRHPPNFNTNTTGGTSQIQVLIPPVHHPFVSEAEIRNVNLYASQSGNFDEDCLVEQLTPASGYTTTYITSLDFLAHQPPDVTTSHGGADKIDPDTELIDYHWLRPVEKKSELPNGGEEGDVRIVIEEHKAYILTKSGWQLWNQGSGGGGGGSATIDVFLEGASGGGATVIQDSFDSGELNTNWAIEEEGPAASTFYTEAAGHIAKTGGGAPMLHAGAEGLDAKVTTKFGGEESFACYSVHLLRSDNADHKVMAGYQGGIGHGNPAKIGVWISGEEGELRLIEESFTEPGLGEYWIVSTINGSTVTVKMYEEDPTSGSPVHEVEVDLFASTLDAVSAELAETYMVPGGFGLQFVGAPGGFTYEWNAEIFESASPDYIQDAAFIEFRDGPELAVGSAHNTTGSGALVTIPSRAGAMGYVNCGEDLTKSRPAFDGVTWLVTGSAGIPEHMAVGDLLIEVGGTLAAQLVKTGSGHFVGL